MGSRLQSRFWMTGAKLIAKELMVTGDSFESGRFNLTTNHADKFYYSLHYLRNEHNSGKVSRRCYTFRNKKL